MAEAKTTPSTVTPTEDEKGGQEGGTGEGNTPKTFTQEQLDDILQKRLDKQEQKFQKDLDKKLEDTKKEWESSKNLTEQEKKEQDLAKKEQDNITREENITRRERRAEALEQFGEMGLPKELVDYVVDLDEEKQSEKIDNFKKNWDAALKKELEKDNEGDAPEDLTNSNKTKKKDLKIKKTF